MKFCNLTPHDVTLANGNLKVVFKKDFKVPTARVEQVVEVRTISCEVAPGMFLDMPVNAVTKATVINLPEPVEGVTYICSTMVADHVQRPDVIAPNTDASCERDAQGRVISVKGFHTFTAGCTIQPEYMKPEPVDVIEEIIEESSEEDMEMAEELTPVPKVDMDMLDPIKSAAKLKAQEKYMKRIGAKRK